jgi:hypothetical protein
MLLFPGPWLGIVLATAAATLSLRHQAASRPKSSEVTPAFVDEQQQQQQQQQRPALVRDALQKGNDSTLYYFGLGSNMLRSKLENRGVNGSKIEILRMEPAVVHNHRLSFRMRGLVPLEPGMGSLDPVVVVDDDSDSKQRRRPRPRQRRRHRNESLFAYSKPDCHGALVTVTAENYEKIMRSEGVGIPNRTNSNNNNGYVEVIVTAIPYDTSRPPVQAVALRAQRPLSYDPCPSARYLSLLQQGAAELGLSRDYQDFLARHPVQQTPSWLKSLSLYNLIGSMALRSGFPGQTGLGRWKSRLLSWLYVPSTVPMWQQWPGQVVMACVLLPGALYGVAYRWSLQLRNRTMSPMMQRFISLLSDNTTIGPPPPPPTNATLAT